MTLLQVWCVRNFKNLKCYATEWVQNVGTFLLYLFNSIKYIIFQNLVRIKKSNQGGNYSVLLLEEGKLCSSLAQSPTRCNKSSHGIT